MSLLDPVEHARLVEQLLASPARIEPGMLLQAQPIILRSGAEIAVHGMDLLGRPCLFGLFQQLDATAWDWLLEAITAFREGLEGSDPVYQRGREPRMFLLCAQWVVQDYARLRFFAESVNVRGYRIHGDALGWELDLCFPAAEGVAEDLWLERVRQQDRQFIRRLLAAAGRGGSLVQVQGGLWPLNLVNHEGPFASLHLGEDGLLMSVPDEDRRYRVLDLNLAKDRDLAIDSVMRHRRVSPSRS